MKYPLPLLFALLLIQCSNPWPEKPYTIKDGHERMIAILDSIARFADPEKHANLSEKHAEILRKNLKKLPNDELPAARLRYAEELIRGGNHGQAVLELTTLASASGDSITFANKAVYELLALAYLRISEVNNCVERHKSEACILPPQPAGQFTDMMGVDNALKIYKRLHRAFPNDAQIRWLYNLMLLNRGIVPDSTEQVSVLPPSFFEVPDNAPRFVNKAVALRLNPTGLAGDACMDDFDNDGDLDLFVVRQALDAPCRYFVQENGQFQDRTSDAHLDGLTGGIQTMQADFDNDGDPDVLILRGGGLEGGTHPNSLLRNNGNNSFTDITIEAGLLSFHPTVSADWADYDGDGWLDLYVVNESRDSAHIHPNELFHNNGNGTFTNIAPQIGVNFVGYYSGVVWGDVNNDRRPDLYLTNRSGNNKLLLNRGSDNNGLWQFQNMAPRAGVTGPEYSSVACFFDYNNDGWEDILCLTNNLAVQDSAAGEVMKNMLGAKPPKDAVKLYRNNGNETFTDMHVPAGLHQQFFAQSCSIGDFDNNGWPDIYVGSGADNVRAIMPNRLFRNLDGNRFEEVTMGGAAHLQKCRGMARGDLDNDGDTDIYTVTGGLFEGDLANNACFINETKNEHRWVQLVLKGAQSNREARGARITLTIQTADRKKRTVHATCGGNGTQRRVETGLGKGEKVLKADIQWPHFSNKTTTIDTVPVNSVIFVKEEK